MIERGPFLSFFSVSDEVQGGPRGALKGPRAREELLAGSGGVPGGARGTRLSPCSPARHLLFVGDAKRGRRIQSF